MKRGKIYRYWTKLCAGGFCGQGDEACVNTDRAIAELSGFDIARTGPRWSWEKQAQPDQICQTEMSKGAVSFYTGSILHHGVANTSKAPRLGLSPTYCLSWLRQEENQCLSCPPDLAQDFYPKLQELLGYYSDPLDKSRGKKILPPELMFGRMPTQREEVTDLVWGCRSA